MSIKRQLFSGSLWSVSGVAANQVFGFVVLAILAHRLSPADFGVVAFALIFVELSRNVMLAGLPDALVRRLDWDDEIASSVFWLNLGAGGVAMAAMVAGGLCVFVYGSKLLAMIFIVLAPAFILDGLCAVPEALMRHQFRFKALAVRMTIANFLGGVAALAAVFFHFGVWSLVVQRMATAGIQAVILWWAARWLPQPRFSYTIIKPLVDFSLHLMGSDLLGQLNLRAVEFIIGVVAGTSVLGVYQIAGKGLNTLLQASITPAQTVALTAFSRLGKKAEIAKAYLRITRMAAFLTFPVFLGAALIAPEFITICFGPKWHEAIPVMMLMALLVAPHTITYFSYVAIKAVGESRLILISSGVTAATNAVAALIAAPFGAVAVAGVTTARAYLTWPVHFWVLKKGIDVDVRDTLSVLAAPGFCASAMTISLGFFRYYFMTGLTPMVSLLLLVLAGAILYPLLLLVFARRSALENFSEFRSLMPGFMAKAAVESSPERR